VHTVFQHLIYMTKCNQSFNFILLCVYCFK